MVKTISFPAAGTLRAQTDINAQNLYNALAQEFLSAIQTSQAQFIDYAIVTHTGCSESNSPRTLLNVFNAELSRQLTELGLDSEIKDKDNYIQNCWRGGDAGYRCDMIRAIQNELVQLGYGVCDIDRGNGDSDDYTIAVLVTWREGYSGKLYNDRCRDNETSSEDARCIELLKQIFRTTADIGWEVLR